MSSTTAPNQFQAVATPGLEQVTAGELVALGATDVQTGRGSVTFAGDLTLGMRASLWLRTVERVRLRLARFHAPRAQRLEELAREIDWTAYVRRGAPLEVKATIHASAMPSADLVERIVRTAITEQVEARQPTAGADTNRKRDESDRQRVDVRLARDTCTLSLDLAGERLDRRGYRLEAGAAPMREHLAAALILSAGWQPTTALVDPMCGSGTLPIEAGWMALDIAPAHGRTFAFQTWPCFAPGPWSALLREADERRRTSLPAPIRGTDRHAGPLGVARRNAERAGVAGVLDFEHTAIEDLLPPADHGLLLVNPPYGRRVRPDTGSPTLYRELGRLLADRWRRWHAAVVSPGPECDRMLGVPVAREVPFRHGGLHCRLLCIEPVG